MSEQKKKGSIRQAIKSVSWAMLGVRRQKGYDEDVANITAKQAIIIGLIGVLLFILTLATVVHFVLKAAQA